MNGRNILLIGNCGSGKTWVMKQLLETGVSKPTKLGLLWFEESGGAIILGKYDGSLYEGSDRLSMAVSTDFGLLAQYNFTNKQIVAEGDRFTNRKFIELFNPYIIKITDSGERGREARGSNQTERHLKSIATRVENIKANAEVKNSQEALTLMQGIIAL
jgi:hypothetical protein